MLKSILLVFAGAVLVATPLAVAGRGAQQTATAPAATQSPSPALPPATPAMGDTGAVAMPGVPDEMMNPVVKPTAASQAKAKDLYSIDCAMCHGDNGNGKTDLATSMGITLPNLTDPKSLADQKDGALFNLIRNGKDKMPGEDKARASDTEVWNLVIYIRDLSKPQPVVYPAK